MDSRAYEVIVVGAGIAGAAAAAMLATDRRTAVLEAEDMPGRHSTGRSAAMGILNYGPPDVRKLTALSRDFLYAPPAGFAAGPLVSPRAVLTLAPSEQREDFERFLAGACGLRELSPQAARDLIPALRPDYAVAAAIEDNAFDIDVAALHQSFLRCFRRLGGTLALNHRVHAIRRRQGGWEVGAGGKAFLAPILVNAAGAWADEVTRLAGVRPIGLTPMRRTGVIIDPSPYAPSDWPLVGDVAQSWYARPEARTRLMVSPADETPRPPEDTQPDELDIAIAIDRLQKALAIEVRRVERAWAGLRCFTPDRSLAIGWDESEEGFFWCVGQGGYGIETAPAVGRLVADMIMSRDPGPAGAVLSAVDPRRLAPRRQPER